MQSRARTVAWVALASPAALLLLPALTGRAAAFPVAMAVHAVSVLVTAGALYRSARSGDPELRRARRWFAAALAVSALGFVTAAVHALVIGRVPVLSPANLTVIGWVAFALAGLLSVPMQQHREGGRLRAVLDCVVVTTGTALVFWMLWLAPIYARSDGSGLAKAVLLAYPVADLVVAAAALAVTAHVRTDVRRFLQVATAGMLLVVISDAGSAATMDTGGGRGFGWTNVALQAGLAVLLCAALLPADLVDQTRPRRLTALVDAGLPHLPVVAAVPVAIWQAARGGPTDLVVFVLGGTMVLGLVGRQALYARHLSAIAQRLSVDAACDPLTGLANRRSWLATVSAALAERQPEQAAVVLLDLDGFKEVNDGFGHAAGDAALNRFADRLTEVAGEQASPARLGGDEFGLLVVGPDAEDRAVRAADALTVALSSTFGTAALAVGASAGVAVSRAGDTTSDLLRRADLAMYEAKRSTLTRVAVFTRDMAERAERRHLLLQALPGAAERGELAALYQPLVRLSTGEVAGAEVLLRWESPLHGLVAPGEFVPLAEESGVVGALGAWVLDRAAQDLAAWQAAGRTVPGLFVNVSARQLVDGFADQAAAIVRAHGVAPSRVTLEITESALPDLQGDRCLEQLRAAGFPLAMDDFGAGFSSLSQLGVLPVSVLKFDREFLRSAETPHGRRILSALTAVARDLGLTTVAEGVETATELAVVRAAGCDLAQGYHLGAPMTAAELWRVLGAAVPAPRQGAEQTVLP